MRVDTKDPDTASVQKEMDAELKLALNEDIKFDQTEAIAEFKKFDKDMSGRLELSELKELFIKMGLQIPAVQFDSYVDALLGHIDKDKNKCVDLSEFLRFYAKVLKSEETRSKFAKKLVKEVSAEEMEANAKLTFENFDVNHDGTIDRSEMAKVLRECLKLDLTDEQWKHYTEDIFQRADKDTSGKLEFAEFLNFYKKCLASAGIRSKYEAKVTMRYQDGSWKLSS